MRLHMKTMWPVSGFMKKNPEVEGSNPKTSRIRKGLKKLFRRAKKEDTGVNLDAFLHPEPAVDSWSPSAVRGPANMSANLTEGSYVNEALPSTTTDGATPSFSNDLGLIDWEEHFRLVGQPENQQGNQSSENTASFPRQTVNLVPQQHISDETLSEYEVQIESSQDVSASTPLDSGESSRDNVDDSTRDNFEQSNRDIIVESATDNVMETARDIVIESEEENSIHGSRLSNRSGNSDAAWETLINMMETRHRDQVSDLQEEHAVEVAEHQENLKCLRNQLHRADRKYAKTQRRVDGLLQSRAELKAQADSSKETVQQLTSDTQALQAQYDELLKKYEDAVQLPSIQSAEPRTRLNFSTDELKHFEENPSRLRRAFELMAKDYNSVLDEARLQSEKVYELTQALELHPEHDIGLQKVVEHKDKMLEDLQTTASQYFSDLSKLRKEKDIAKQEISRLKALSEGKNSIIGHYRSSIDKYKELSESILDKLRNRADANDIIRGMESYFQTTRSDNDTLSVNCTRQEEQLDELTKQISKLETDLLQAQISLGEKDDLCEEIKHDMRKAEIEVTNLQMKSEFLEGDLERAAAEKKSMLDKFAEDVAAINANVREIMNGTVDERTRAYLNLLDAQTEENAARYQRVCDENYELQKSLAQLQEERNMEKCLVYYDNAGHDNLEARLRDADEKITALRNENQLLQKLPPTINVDQYVAEREELEKAREKIQFLEQEISTINMDKVLQNRQALERAREKIRHLERFIREEEWVYGYDLRRRARRSFLKMKHLAYQFLIQVEKMNKADQRGEGKQTYEQVARFISVYTRYVDSVKEFEEDEEEEGEVEDKKGIECFDVGLFDEPANQPDVKGKGKERADPGPSHAEALVESHVSAYQPDIKGKGKERAAPGPSETDSLAESHFSFF